MRRAGNRPGLTTWKNRIVPGLTGLVAFGALAAGWACSAEIGEAGGTRKMAALLKRLADEADPSVNPFMNSVRAKILEKAVLAKTSGAGPPLLMELGKELLSAGRTTDAIAQYERLDGMARAQALDARSKAWSELRMQEAIAQLRRGEEENCMMNHNAHSCVFPIRGSGIHTQTRGSQAAATILNDLLEHEPGNLAARWLLNIAYMTLGEYPDQVPARWRLAPELFESDYDIKPFPDIAASLGLDKDDYAGGSIVEDFDGDGNLDIMVSAMGLRSQLRYYHNDADGKFSDRTQQAGLDGEVGGLNIVQTDYDNDGRPDVLVLRGGWMGKGGVYPSSLLHNDGGGAFSDVTEAAGMLRFAPTQTATWFDYDNDGWLDVFIGNESTEDNPHPCELFHNNRNGTFTECGAEAGVAVTAFVKGVTSADYDNDGRPDIYVSVRGGDNLLFHNDGHAAGKCGGHFTDRARASGVTEPFYSFPTWFFDYDNDGREDLFVSGYMVKDVGDVVADYLGRATEAERPRLYHNNDNGTFTDLTQGARLSHVIETMGSNYGDLDNDGWLDMFLATGAPDLSMLVPDRVFRNAGGKFFQDVTTSGGFGQLQKGHGVSFGDLDNDGDQDIVHVVGGALETDHFRSSLFENPGHGNHFLVLKLEGTRSNRAAIGARIQVVVRTDKGAERTICRTVRTGGSFGASPLRQEIGLGDARQILSVGIRWPSGDTAKLTGLAVDQRYVVREGEARVTPLVLKAFRLRGRDDRHAPLIAGTGGDPATPNVRPSPRTGEAPATAPSLEGNQP
jgi:FG-GAP-like repeat/ASPIC and UnbV